MHTDPVSHPTDARSLLVGTVHHHIAVSLAAVIGFPCLVVLVAAVVYDAIARRKVRNYAHGFIALDSIVARPGRITSVAGPIVFAVVPARAWCFDDDISIGFAAVIGAVVIIIVVAGNNLTAIAAWQGCDLLSGLIGCDHDGAISAPAAGAVVFGVIGVITTGAWCLDDDISVGIAGIVCAVVIVVVAAGNDLTAVAAWQGVDPISGLISCGRYGRLPF